MHTEHYEKLLDKNASESVPSWDLQRMKDNHAAFLQAIYKTIEEANMEYRKLVTEMRQAQNDYFKCQDSSKKKALQLRAMEKEAAVDRFKIDLPPQPVTIQKPLFE